jgi:glutathione S-transferase
MRNDGLGWGMALTLHYHPLSSFCWKVLIALYEKQLDFERVLIDFGDPGSAGAFRALWPLGKMPVLEDGALALPETSIIIEHLDLRHPGPVPLIPTDPAAALEVRLRDRLLDLYVHLPMQKIVGDRLRPEAQRDGFGVEEARRGLRTAYALIESRFAPAPWAAGADFSLADCAAAPALYYANRVEPFAADHPGLALYLDRLKARPSVARVLEEAEPYFHMFPA